MSKESSLNDFGSYIAYLIPGATALAGLSQFSATLRTWFATAATDAPTIGGFLYLTVASLAAGMTVNAIRWAVVDSLHHGTGLVPPALDFSKLGRNVEAYRLLIEIHYRFYQFHSAMVVALTIAYASYRVRLGTATSVAWPDAVFLVLEVIFFATSRHNLNRYYSRTRQLLSAQSP